MKVIPWQLATENMKISLGTTIITQLVHGKQLVWLFWDNAKIN